MSVIPVFNENLHIYLTDEAGNIVQSERGYYVAIDRQGQGVIEVCLPDIAMSSATDCDHSIPDYFLDNSKENEDVNIQATTVIQPSTSSTALPPEGNSQLKKSRGKVSGAQGTVSLSNKPARQTASNVAIWTDQSVVRSLVHLWSANQELFASTIMKNDDVWKIVAEELNTLNKTQYSLDQGKNKIKELKRKYTETKDHNMQSGAEVKTCPFYEELDEILGKKPCVKPVALASNRRPVLDEMRKDVDCEEPEKKKKKSSKSDVLDEIREWRAESMEYRRTTDAEKQKQREEQLKIARESIDSMDARMGQLINVLAVSNQRGSGAILKKRRIVFKKS